MSTTHFIYVGTDQHKYLRYFSYRMEKRREKKNKSSTGECKFRWAGNEKYIGAVGRVRASDQSSLTDLEKRDSRGISGKKWHARKQDETSAESRESLQGSVTRARGAEIPDAVVLVVEPLWYAGGAENDEDRRACIGIYTYYYTYRAIRRAESRRK